jgi:hypothetical protein
VPKVKKPEVLSAIDKEEGCDYCECEEVGTEDDGFYGHMRVGLKKKIQIKSKGQKSYV